MGTMQILDCGLWVVLLRTLDTSLGSLRYKSKQTFWGQDCRCMMGRGELYRMELQTR